MVLKSFLPLGTAHHIFFSLFTSERWGMIQSPWWMMSGSRCWGCAGLSAHLLSYPCGQLATGSWAPHLKLERGLFSAWHLFPEGRFRGSKLMDRQESGLRGWDDVSLVPFSWCSQTHCRAAGSVSGSEQREEAEQTRFPEERNLCSSWLQVSPGTKSWGGLFKSGQARAYSISSKISVW